VVGRRCVIGHGAILHGCTVGDGAVIGANAVVFDLARVGAGAMVTAGSVVYPKTTIPPRTLFRNSAAGNHPVTEPVGARMQRWQATSYRRVIAMYRASGADQPTRRARPLPHGHGNPGDMPIALRRLKRK
ncbi:MAG: gamma carbonic anhydrase family protein, partial [Dehalococcoidia bacterium]